MPRSVSPPGDPGAGACHQGLSLGGEYGASATYLSESPTPERLLQLQYVTLIGGQLTAQGDRSRRSSPSC
jgi:hypothetical protein